MEFSTKCMYLGKFEGKTKDGNPFKQVKVLDKKTNDTIVCYVQEFGKFDKLQPYADIDLKFNLYKDFKGNWRVQLLED